MQETQPNKRRFTWGEGKVDWSSAMACDLDQIADDSRRKSRGEQTWQLPAPILTDQVNGECDADNPVSMSKEL